MAGTPVLTCPQCRGTLEYHVTIEMLDPPIGKVDTGYCVPCARLFECVRQTNTYYQSTSWPPLCRECRQPVSFAGVTGDPDAADVARYNCREHPREQWTWTQSGDRWTRVDA
jgi:hypothetical protein